MSFVFEIENSIETREVYPLGRINLNWNEIDLDFCKDYSMELKSNIEFIGNDFQYFLGIEKSELKCQKQILRIYQKCNSRKKLRFTGSFSTSDGKWNLDACHVEFKVKDENVYQCIEEFKDNEYNLFEILDRQTAYSPITFSVENFNCVTDVTSGMNEPTEPVCDANEIYEGQWQIYLELHNSSGSGSHYKLKSYKRLVAFVNCDSNLEFPWVLINECENGIRKYARRPEVIDTFDQHLPPSEFWEFRKEYNLNIDDAISNISEFDNGLRLRDCFVLILDKINPDLILKSNFFQWNPTVASNINYVTGELSRVMNLIFYQKSDIKRPNATGNATKNMEISFAKLIKNICSIFNLGFIIEGNTFILEHISYFSQVEGIDLASDPKLVEVLKGTRKYSYEKEKMYKYEKYNMMEAEGADFVGKDIWYDNSCVDPKLSKKIEVSDITTDVMMCVSNSKSDSQNVSDSGFALLACDLDNNIIMLPGILDAKSLNNSLSWAYLHIDYYKYGRVLMRGYMNDELTEFLSTEPNKKQESFSIPFCCELWDVFDPTNQIKSTLGWSKLKSMNYDLNDKTAEVELNPIA